MTHAFDAHRAILRCVVAILQSFAWLNGLRLKAAPFMVAFLLTKGAMMGENKTKPTNSSAAAYIDALPDQTRRSEAKALVQLMQRVSGEKPKMWGSSIIGFGSYHYKYDSGREGDTLLIGFSPRKAANVLYGLLGSGGAEHLRAKLGKHTTGKGCLYIKKLADVNTTVLETLIRNAVAHHAARSAKAS